jgi:hypothetical protein
MGQEIEYAIEARYRYNSQGDDGKYLDPPVWGEWGKWTSRRVYSTLAGAAMAKSQAQDGVRHYSYGSKAATHEQETRVSYRLVPKEWTPLLPELGTE